MSLIEENEEVRQLVDLWRRYGTYLISGVVIGLVLLGSWRAYQSHQLDLAEQASAAYQSFQEMRAKGDKAGMQQAGENLKQAHPGSPYATLAALQLGHQSVVDGAAEAAKTQLNWAEANAPLPQLAAIARLRLAQLELSNNQTEAALALLDSVPEESFTTLYQHTKGDVLMAAGRLDEARQAYEDAEAAGAGDALLKLKRESLEAN